MKKDIHIVFGDSAKGTLKCGMKNKVQLLCLEDALNIGPVYDVNSIEEKKKDTIGFQKRNLLATYIIKEK